MRTVRPIAVAALVSLLPVAAGPVAQAQTVADDPTTAMARARFKEGVEFYDKGEYEQARASFLQAYALKKHPAVLLNLAWSCLRSSHPLEAERYFKQFLLEGKEASDKQRADANDGLGQARAKLGRIEVVAAAGTDVTVDGERLGTAPLAEAVPAEAGAHVVKFRGVDGAVEALSVTVATGEKALARFRATSPPTAAGVPPTPAAPAEPTTPRPAAPPAASRPPAPQEELHYAASHPLLVATGQTSESDKGGGAFAPPKNLLPVVLLGVGALAGYGASLAMFLFKQSAQDRANSLAGEINSAGGSAICGAHTAACNAYNTDVSNVNDDALVGNIALGVGVVATAGVIVYWLAADKERHSGAGAFLAPMVAPHTGGASLVGRF